MIRTKKVVAINVEILKADWCASYFLNF